MCKFSDEGFCILFIFAAFIGVHHMKLDTENGFVQVYGFADSTIGQKTTGK